MTTASQHQIGATKAPTRQETYDNPAVTLAWINTRISAIYAAAIEDQQNSKPPPISTDAYLQIYTAVHDYCVPGRDKGTLNGQDLYRSLEQEIRKYCTKIKSQIFAATDDVQDEDAAGRLLTAYLARWEKFAEVARVLRNFMGVLERHYITRVIDEKRKDVSTLDELHKLVWREEVLQTSVDDASTKKGFEDLTDAVVMLQEKGVRMTHHEIELVKKIVKSLSLVNLCLDD